MLMVGVNDAKALEREREELQAEREELYAHQEGELTPHPPLCLITPRLIAMGWLGLQQLKFAARFKRKTGCVFCKTDCSTDLTTLTKFRRCWKTQKPGKSLPLHNDPGPWLRTSPSCRLAALREEVVRCRFCSCNSLTQGLTVLPPIMLRTF